MTSIDRAFQKAYAKRAPVSAPVEIQNAEEPQAQPSAQWVDEESDQVFRADASHPLPTPHLNRDEHGGRQPAVTATEHPPHTGLTEHADDISDHMTNKGGTTAYDAWTERLQDMEPPVPQTHSHRDSAIPRSFTAAWEVDRFAIPSTTEQILEDHLGPIGGQLERASREGLHTLAICSQRRGTGRSTMAIAIAQAAADSGLRVVLVDADVDNPALTERLQLEVESDWVDTLSAEESIEESTIQSLGNKFCFVPLLEKTPEKLHRIDQHAHKLVDQLNHYFDLIVMDFGPLDQASFGRCIPLNADLVDAVIMVEDMHKTNMETLESLARRVRAVGIDNIGLIENFIRVDTPVTAQSVR